MELRQQAPVVGQPVGRHVARGTVPRRSVAVGSRVSPLRAAFEHGAARDCSVVLAGGVEREPQVLFGACPWAHVLAAVVPAGVLEPERSLIMIARLEILRDSGAELLLIAPAPGDWLAQRPAFRRHVESRCAPVAMCERWLLLDLRRHAAIESGAWLDDFEGLVRRCAVQLSREPAVLDWDSGLELATRFDEHLVFSPPSPSPALPYLDRSVDIVVVDSEDLDRRHEARRVAAVAVACVARGDVEIEWLAETPTAPEPTTSVVAFGSAAPLANADGLSLDVDIVVSKAGPSRVIAATRVAMSTDAEVVIFLDGDLHPLPGWLPGIWDELRMWPGVGVVASRLVGPDGTLLGAGGEIRPDGVLRGRGQSDRRPFSPPFSFSRPADFASPSLLAMRTSVFRRLSGFDADLGPALAVVDLCLRARRSGFATRYVPAVSAVAGRHRAYLAPSAPAEQKRFRRRWPDASIVALAVSDA